MHKLAKYEFIKSQEMKAAASSWRSSEPVPTMKTEPSPSVGRHVTPPVEKKQLVVKAHKVAKEESVMNMLNSLEFDDDDIKVKGTLDNGKDTWTGPTPFILDPVSAPSTLLAMKGMLASFSDKVFTFPLTRFATLVTGGGGTMALSTFVYPSQFDQYNQLSVLFEECKQVSVHADVTAVYAGTLASSALPVPFIINFEPQAYSSSPTMTIALANRIPGSKLITSGQTNWPVSLSHKFKNKVWSQMNATEFGNDPTGLSGRFNWVAMTATTASTTYLAYRVTAIYQMRGLV